MSDTLSLPTYEIQAVLQECSGISPLEREGIMARLKARDVTSAPVVGTAVTYVLAGVNSSLKCPDLRGFDLLEWRGEELPYELLHEVSIPHMVVVTDYAIYATSFFEMLKSQKGLEIGALEFLILPNLKDDAGRDFVEHSVAKGGIEGSSLMNWAGESNSIKIITKEERTVEAQLKRHVRHVVKGNSLHNLRGLTDADRLRISNGALNPSVNQIQTVLQPCPSIPPVERGSELDIITYVVVNLKGFMMCPNLDIHQPYDLVHWVGNSPIPREFLEKTYFSHVVVVTDSAYYAAKFLNLLMSKRGFEIGDLEFLIFPNLKDTFEQSDLQTKTLDGTLLKDWAHGSDSIKIIKNEGTTLEQEMERHARFVLKHGALNLEGINDGDQASFAANNRFWHQQ